MNIDFYIPLWVFFAIGTYLIGFGLGRGYQAKWLYRAGVIEFIFGLFLCAISLLVINFAR